MNEGEIELPEGDYQFSEVIEIDSEWRAFVYKNKLVGLQNYSGDFKISPNIEKINQMIEHSQPFQVAYTLDVGVNSHGTFIIEAHPMISVGLYGFADHKILPYMFYQCFCEYVDKNRNK